MYRFTNFKAWGITLFVFLSFNFQNAKAQHTLLDNEVVVTNGIITSCSYLSYTVTDIIIPETLDGQTVIGIANGASAGLGVFYRKEYTSVQLPSTIEMIGDYAFYYNKISNLDLSNCTNLTSIGKTAFGYNRLTSINLSGCGLLETIGMDAFGSNSIASVNLEGLTLLTSIGNNAFYTNSITSVNLSGCSALKTIGDYAFDKNNINNLDLTACTSLSSVARMAFYGNSLTSLDLSDCTALTFIGALAFYSSTLSSFELPQVTGLEAYGWNGSDGSTFTGGATVSNLEIFYWVPVPYTLTDDDVVVTNGEIISCSYDFSSTDIIIPQTLDAQTVSGIAGEESSASWVFYNKGITSIQLPSTLETIGRYAFYNNTSMVNIDFSSCTALTTIGDGAFSYNQYLNGVNLSGCVALTNIGERAFASNISKSVNFTGCISLDTIGDYAFENNDITELDLSECTSLKYIGESSFYENSITNLNLANCTALTTIGGNSFNSNSITSLDFSDCSALSSVGYAAFSENALTSINFSGCSSLVTIGDQAFFLNAISSVNFTGCTALSNIMSSAFSNNSLAQLDLTACTGLSIIGYTAFYANALTSIDLSNCSNLKLIEEYAFYQNQLSGFSLPIVSGFESNGWRDGKGNIYTGGDIINDFETFYEVPIPYTLTDNDVVVTNGILESCSYNFEIKDIIIPDTLDGQKIIGIADASSSNTGIFYNKGLTSVKLPLSLETIGNYTFFQNAIYTIDLTNFSALKSIGKNAFEDNNLSGLILTGCISLTEIGDMAFQGNLIAGLDFSDCTNLTTINYSAFYHNKLGSVDFSNCTKLQFIGQSAFSYNSISGIDLSECTSLTYIGKDAFNSNNFSNFNLPVVTQYETLGWRDEYGNKYAGGENAGSLSSFYMVPIPYVLTNDDVVVNAGIIESCSYDYARIDIIIPDTLDGQLVKGIASSVNLSSGIFSMKGIASIQFPASLESIGNYAFFQNQLYELDLTFCPDLNTIGIQAFNYNGSLESLNLSACTKIVSISNYAFANCALDTIDLNACTAISSIGDYAFYNNSISHLAISGCTALMSIGNYAFSGNSITSFILPIINGYEEFGWKDGSNNRFIGGSSVTNLNTYYVVALPYTLTDNDVVLTNGEITFCSYNFANTDIIIPDTLDGQVVKGIANAATATEGVFYNKGISWLQLPSSIQYIGEYSFCLNSTLETLDLSRCSALLRINQQAFTGDGLSEIDLSNCTELNYIGYGAFYGNSLIGINLTNCHKLTYIASRAFYLNSFSSFVLPVITGFEAYGWKDGNNHSFIGGQTVSDLNTYYVAPIPYTLTDDDVVVINGMIESCSYDFSHTDIIIPDTLDGQKVIGIINGSNESTGVFNNSPLTSIKLPVTFEVIGNYAFANNYVLTGNLDLSNFSSLTTIGDHAFDGSTFTGIDFSNCISLVYIGKEAFNSSVFPDLDLSDCTALTTIGEYAFIENQITSLDLSQCNNLSLIGEGAFYLNPLSDFTLPITSNYLTYWWTDGNGNVYEGGASATDLTTEYTLSVPYTLSDDDVVVEDGIIISCSYDFSQTNIIIPDTLDGQTIIGIAKGTWQNAVFYNKGISTLQLPSYIQTIGDYSFSDNSIFNIDFSKCTELDSIGNSAFVNNQIDSLDLSTCASLIYIGEEAFSENLLTSINLNGCTLLNTIDEYAFHNNLLTSVDLTFCVSLSSLEYGVFSDNELTSLKINGLTTLTSIGEYCFAYNSLTSVDLSGCTNLTSIGRMAFYDNYTISSLDLTNCTFLSFIGDEAFYENSLAAINLTPCTALTFIGNNAFGYNQLTEFTLPTVTGLEIYGWRDGDGNRYTGGETITNFDTYYQVPLPYTLTDDDVVVANGIIVSCSYNFERTDIIIPDTLDGQMVTEIRDTLNNYGIFREKGITSLQLPSTLQKIGDYSFYGNSITSLDLSICPGLISIGDQAFVYYDDYHNWNPITELNLNACNSLTTIGYGAFNSQKITNLDLSDCSSLTLIEDYAFQWCPITNLNVSGCSALTRIGKYAFRDTEIENLDLTGCTSLASIGEYAFAYVTPMTSLDLSDCSSLTSIENRAFFGTTLASGFVLPTPEIPGFNLDYWLDGTAVQHAGGETVSNTNTSYSAVLTRAILITFNVSDGINPLQGITINLDGFGEKNTDNSGVARFTAATKDSISYTASAPGYITVNDSVSAIDTVVTENVVMVLCNDSIAIFDTICDGDMVLYNDSTCTENGQYVFIFPNRFGCDSVITLNLTVNPSESIVFDSTICEGDSFNIGDSVYSENGTYINKYPNRYGCDSTVTLHLTVLPSQAVERSEVICEGSNIQIGDSIYIKSGTFITELINQYGCDSIVTLHLTVNPVDSTFLTEIICEGEQIIVGDSVYTQTGFFSNILVNQNGCDSTIVLNLTVNPVHQLEQNSEICEGEFITIGDSTYNKTGTFITNLTNQYGCDSTITLNLTVNRIDTTNLAETICEGDTIFLGDQPFTQSGIFLKTFSNQFGCDSVVHLNLNILPKFVTVQDLICEGDSVNIGPKFYSATGVYTDTLNNFLGCDSIVTLQLTVLPKETMLEKTVCHGELVPFGDSVYTETGIYIDSLQNVLGCDSIVFLDLVANRVDSIKREEIICQGESVQIGDSVYSSSGYFTINFLNQYGCDSVITLNLTVNPTHKFISDAEICEGEEYLFQGNYYDVQGNYSDTFTNQYGCDSIYMLNLVVHPSNRIVFRDTVTYGDSYSFRGTDYTSGGLYSDTLNNQFGCDSIISLLLYVYYEPIVDIPDSLFKAELLNDTLINTNHDDEIQVAEAVAYTGLVQVEGKNIQSFIGIEAFKNIDSLWCANNLADSLDLSTNTKLVYVDCSDNNIEFLDIDHLILLTKLDISGNELNGVQLNENTELEILNCSNNQLNSLDLSISNKLNELNCSDNALTELNLRNGNNINLSVLATGNTGLNCVTVDNTDWANANWESFFDAGILFSTDCNAPDIAINSIGFIPGDVYPGDEITISWKVMNYGNAAAVGGWNERISLISPSNQKLYLNGNLVYAYTLAATDTVLRSAKLEIPALTSFSGPAYVMVELIPTGSLVNEESVLVNNKQVSDSTLILHDLLGFSILESSAFENYSGTLRGTVSRSGNSDTTLTVNLITSGSDLSIPASVKITTGNNATNFYFTLNNNDLFDGIRLVEVVASADGLDPVSDKIEILDDDIPNLSITIDRDSCSEGEIIYATVRSEIKLDTTQTILISASKSGQVGFNSTLTIPANDSSVQVEITITDDSKPELDQSLILTASASGFISGKDTIILLDNDIPEIELVVVTDTLCESAGDNATWLKVTRNKDNAETITVALSTFNSNEVVVPEYIHFFPGDMEELAAIDVIDNEQVDGYRTVSVTGAIYIPTCNCISNTTGKDTTQIVLADDDGPALKLSCSPITLSEGQINQGTLNITRNASNSMTLLVHLTTNNPGELLLQDTVTIPAGSSSVDVPVMALNDSIDDGQQTVTIKAGADNYSPGTVTVYTSDQSKPDLSVGSFAIAHSQIQTKEQLEFTASVLNTGQLKAPSGITLDLYLSKNDKLDNLDLHLQQFTTNEVIPIGGAISIWELVSMPSNVGSYYLILRVNNNQNVTELLYLNNNSQALSIELQANFNAMASVAEETFISAEPILITGSAVLSDSTPAINKEVEIYVITQGIRRSLSATTDGEGKFSVTFEPGSNEVGHYIIGVCYPGANLQTAQDEFDIMGFGRTSASWLTWYLHKGETINGSFTVKNFSNAELTGLKLNFPQKPAGFEIQVNTISVLEGNQTASFNFSLTGSVVSPGLDYIKIPVIISSDQGVKFEFTALYYCQALEGLLKTEPISLNSSFTKDKIRYVEFIVYNSGAGNTGTVSLSLPDVDWMSLASSSVLENIAPGENAKVTLRLQSNEDTPLNLPMEGQIAINAEHCEGLLLPYRMECVSEESGNLFVDVVDEYTYNTEEAPHLANAHVKVSNPYTGKIVGEANTDSFGHAEFQNIPEGIYVLLVEAERHDGYQTTVTIDPGRTTEELVFISFQAITYSWTVVPTEIEDKYKITLELVYETNVPMPVVAIDMPQTMPVLVGDETYSFMVTLTNLGLISAEDVDLDLPENDAEYEFVFVDNKHTIAAKESIQIPVTFRRRNLEKSASVPVSSLTTTAKNGEATTKCSEMVIYAYGWKCGDDNKWERVTYPIRFERCTSDDQSDEEYFSDATDDDAWSAINTLNQVFDAVSIPSIYEGLMGQIPTIPASPTNVNPGTSSTGTGWLDTDITGSYCNPCYDGIASALAGCYIDGTAGTIIGILGCLRSLIMLDFSTQSMVDCVAGFTPAGCVNGVVSALRTCYSQYQNVFDNEKSALISGEEMPANIEQAFNDLLYFEAAYNASIEWSDEFWGPVKWQEKIYLSEFAAAVGPFIDTKIPFEQNDVEQIKNEFIILGFTELEIEAFTNRWNSTLAAWNQNIYSPDSNFPDIVDNDLLDYAIWKTDSVNRYVQNRGASDLMDLYSKARNDLQAEVDANRNSVCASVSLSISQKLVMTREAFRGTLTLFNGNEQSAIEEFELKLEIKNQNGELCNDLFQIEPESLSQLSAIDGTGTLPAMETGTAIILFIPEKGAAPTITQSYSFGGSIAYLDPFTKTTVTKTLFPVTLEVHPSPDLYLHYFMQRDILGDDPLTENITEPVIPAELALMIENNGYGDAKNIRIESAQPEIIDNEKGLLIEFELIGSNLQGVSVNMGLINIDFGTATAQTTRIGQWWFTSNLLGHFANYSANLTHTDSRGNPDLSLVSGATLHELIQSISVYGALDDNIPDFLVNDIADVKENPDAIYLSQGQTVLDVYESTGGSFDQEVKAPAFTNALTVSPRFEGWNYLKLDDPGEGLFAIASVTRNNDGQEIPLNNAWLTFITMPDGAEHVYENKFHIVDNFEAMALQTYTIVWVPLDTVPVEVVEIQGTPESPATSPVTELTVIFNKKIDPASFSFEDIELTLENGGNLSSNLITITQVDALTYNVNIANLATGDGTYEFTILTATINDKTGNTGREDNSTSWSQYLSVPAIEEFTGVPSNRTNQVFNAVQIRFNMEIDPTTLTSDDLALERNGTVVSATLSVHQLEESYLTFAIEGISGAITEDAVYKLFVDLNNVRSVTGIYGESRQFTEWTFDSTPPGLAAISELSNNKLDVQHVPGLRIEFSEAIKDFTKSDFELSKNNLILTDTKISILPLSESVYQITGFDTLTYREGSYTVNVFANQLADVAGNYGIQDDASYSWKVDRTPPSPVTDIALIPDLGISNLDRITTEDSISISMTVPEDKTTIYIFETNGTLKNLLAHSEAADSGQLVIPVQFANSGQITAEIVCSDSVNNQSSVPFKVYLDNSDLQATITGAWLTAGAVHPDSLIVNFSDAIYANDFDSACISIKYNDILIGSDQLTISQLDANKFVVKGFENLPLRDGKYSLAIDMRRIRKLLSGRYGTSLVKTNWEIEIPNSYPVANAGTDTTVRQGQVIQLNGLATFDPDGDPLSYKWYFPASLSLSDVNTLTPSFVVPFDEVGTTYTLMLSASDGELSHTDKTVITIEKAVIEDTVTVTICSNEPYELGTQLINVTGIYTDTLSTLGGADSIVHLFLTVNPADSVTITKEVCEGENIAVGDSVYHSSGTFVTRLSNQYGCDSVVTLNLTVNAVDSVFLNETICEGDSVSVGDTAYFESGIFSKTLVNRFGCDSVVILNLTVNPVQTVLLSQSICKNEFVMIGDSTYDESGVYTTTLSNRFGCDSVVVLDLIVHSADTTYTSAIICYGESYELNGIEYTQSGLYSQTLTSVTACDSTIILNLTVLPETTTILDAAICAGETYILGDSVYVASGQYTQTLKASNGCDSLVVLNLSVNAAPEYIFDVGICEGETYNFNDSIYANSGTFTFEYQDQNGCDSTITLILSVNSPDEVTIYDSMTGGSTYLFSGQELFEGGVYSDTLTNIYGCDSVVHLHLSVVENKAPIVQNHQDDVNIEVGDSISFEIDLAATIFYDADDESLNYGFSIVPEQNGWIVYEFENGLLGILLMPEIQDTGCYSVILEVIDPLHQTVQDTFNICVTKKYDGIADWNSAKPVFKIYPNPAHGNVNIELNAPIDREIEVLIFDNKGRNLLRKTYKSPSGKLILDVSEYASGIYLVTILNGKKHYTRKLIIKQNE